MGWVFGLGLGPFYSEVGKAQKVKIGVSRGALEGYLNSRFCVFVGVAAACYGRAWLGKSTRMQGK